MIYTYQNFISSTDIQQIRQKVYNLKDIYRPVTRLSDNCDYSSVCACTLGNAIYAHREIDNNINRIMKNTFADLYQITIDRLKSIFNITNVYLFDFSVPGFHVFRGKELNERVNNLHFHTDRSLLNHCVVDSSIVDEEFMYSFMTLIENTNDPSYLDLENNKHYYEHGDFNVWCAHVPHRIGASKFGDSDSRITYQGHIFKAKHSNSYYLYF